MQFTKLSAAAAAALSLFALALATPTPVEPRAPAGPAQTPTNNAGRPVANGACCVANTSLRQDVCKDAAGASGRCVPSNSAGCGGSLTCVADTKLVCDPTQTDRGRELCKATS